MRFSLADCGSTSELTLTVAPRIVAARGQTVEEWRVNGITLEP